MASSLPLELLMDVLNVPSILSIVIREPESFIAIAITSLAFFQAALRVYALGKYF